jgi:hypothetical protein
MPTGHAGAMEAMEASLEPVVPPQCMASLARMSQHTLGLPRQRPHGAPRSDRASARHLMRQTANGPARNRGHGLKKVPGLRVAVQNARNLADSMGEARSRSCYRASNFGEQLLRQWRSSFRHHGQQLTGCHSNEGQKMLCSLIFCFGFGGQFSQMFHHGVGIDFAHGIEFVLAELSLLLVLMFVLVFHLFFHFLFAEQAADHIADGAQPALAFEADFMLHFFFQFFLEFVLVFRVAF